MSAVTPMGGDFEALGIWRFHRQDTGIGSRFESALVGGALIPGPQEAAGVLRGVRSGPGALIGGVTGIASRAHYAWAGATYQRYASRGGEHRPDLLFYSAAYAYRPPSWRTDSGWDWRIFGELTGERSGAWNRAPGAHQVFLGPTTLGVYRTTRFRLAFRFPSTAI